MTSSAPASFANSAAETSCCPFFAIDCIIPYSIAIRTDIFCNGCFTCQHCNQDISIAELTWNRTLSAVSNGASTCNCNLCTASTSFPWASKSPSCSALTNACTWAMVSDTDIFELLAHAQLIASLSNQRIPQCEWEEPIVRTETVQTDYIEARCGYRSRALSSLLS